MARAVRGFGPKAIFFDVLKAHFDRPANARRLFTALLGCACEQWINGEYFLALNASRRAFAVIPEREKHDLVLTTVEDQSTPRLVVETKLVYAGYALKKQEAKLQDLRRQLAIAGQKYPQARVVGLVVSFWWRDPTQVPVVRNYRGKFVDAARRAELGLGNDFRQPNPYRVKGPSRVKVAGRWYDVGATFEVVRASGASALSAA